MDKPKMRYCLKLDKAKYYYRIDPITAIKIITKAIKSARKRVRKREGRNNG